MEQTGALESHAMALKAGSGSWHAGVHPFNPHCSTQHHQLNRERECALARGLGVTSTSVLVCKQAVYSILSEGSAQQHTPRDYTSDKPCACMVPALHSGQNNKRMPACLPARPPHAHTTILLYCLCAGVYLPVSTRTEQMVQEKIIFRKITINLTPLYVPVSWKRVTDTITLHQNLVPPKPACYLCHQERERKKKNKKTERVSGVGTAKLQSNKAHFASANGDT